MSRELASSGHMVAGDHVGAGKHRTPRQTSVFERFCVFLYLFIIFFSGFIVYPCLVFIAYHRPILWFILFEYIWYCCSPAGKRAARSDKPGWPRLLRYSPFYRIVQMYFPVRLHKTADLPPGRPYLACLHPHGILAFSGTVGYVTSAAGFDRLFPGIVFHGLTLVLSFRTPFVREFHLLHGSCDVSEETFLNVLGAGGTVGVVVGGGAESLYTTPGTHRIILRRRRGFIRMALLTGASLVPGYAFGENNLYRTTNELPHRSRIRRFQRWMDRKFGFTVPLFHGLGVVLPWGLVPYPVPIDIVIGAAVHVPKYEGDTKCAEFRALVDKYHGIYTAALTQLFEDHREKFAKGEGPLEIVE